MNAGNESAGDMLRRHTSDDDYIDDLVHRTRVVRCELTDGRKANLYVGVREGGTVRLRISTTGNPEDAVVLPMTQEAAYGLATELNGAAYNSECIERLRAGRHVRKDGKGRPGVYLNGNLARKLAKALKRNAADL